MDGFVVLARFDLRPGTGALFQRLVLDNARASVRDEPGCRRFDVLSARDGADRATLYEIYDDAGAFAAHKATPHYAAFRDATKDLVEALVVEEYDLTENAAG